MILRFVSAALAAAAVLAVPAAQGDDAALVAGNTAFAVDLYRVLAQEPGNLFCSPLSVSTALGMTYAGARSQTEADMAAALRFGLPQERLHLAFAELRGRLAALEADGSITLRTANGLWLERTFPLLESYASLVTSLYEAGLEPADFVGAAEAARQEINAWVEGRTEGKIAELIPSGAVDRLTVLVLVNAIYLKAAWAEPFEAHATSDAPFHVAAGVERPVPMMRRTATMAYGENDLAQVVELPYRGGAVSMVVVLPRSTDGLAAVEAALSAESLAEWTSSLAPARVALSLPRFRVERSFSLKQALGALGMASAFDPGQADFTGMAKDGEIFISDVFHKAFVDVDEQGTEAAAATAVVMARTSFEMPEKAVEFRADHPFLFLIRERETGAVLFIGRLVDPAAGGAGG
ncbi:MAG: serpin family protein [Candidatus Eisenbacteria bacterium]|nr:serpin family protein [Candidatus Eisenbacteria bacterium]